MSEVRYPEVIVDLGDLDGPEGNAFVVLGTVDAALERAGVSLLQRNVFREQATSGDYQKLLATAREWVTCI